MDIDRCNPRFSSVLNTQFRKLLNHDCKRYVEEWLFESGTVQHLNYTVLKPGNFLEMFPIEMLANQEQPVFPTPFVPSVANSVIILEDLAAVALKVIDEREAHFFAEYPLVSTLPVSYTDIAAAASKALGKEIQVDLAPFDERAARLTRLILGPDPNPRSHDASERLILWYDRHGLCGSPNVMEMLLGRKATTVDEWMAKRVQAARAKKS